jgi:hypothetical protein
LPHTAAGLSKLAASDADKPVGARIEQHPLEHQPAALLLIGTLADRHACLAETVGQLVTDVLQLTQVE